MDPDFIVFYLPDHMVEIFKTIVLIAILCGLRLINRTALPVRTIDSWNFGENVIHKISDRETQLELDALFHGPGPEWFVS